MAYYGHPYSYYSNPADIDYYPYNHGHPYDMDKKLNEIESKLREFIDAYYLPEPLPFSKEDCLETISDIMHVLEMTYKAPGGQWKNSL